MSVKSDLTKYLKEKIKNNKVTSVLILIGIFSIIFLIISSHFKEKRTIEEIQNAYTQNQYEEVLKLSSRYYLGNNQKLKTIIEDSEKQIKIQKEKELLEYLKKVSEDQAHKKRDIYFALKQLDRNNPE